MISGSGTTMAGGGVERIDTNERDPVGFPAAHGPGREMTQYVEKRQIQQTILIVSPRPQIFPKAN
ncbi:MAG: hypothetical protein ACM34H_01485, partial [Deltaproteobacteria bacterium]